jgi:hypothetical protein
MCWHMDPYPTVCWLIAASCEEKKHETHLLWKNTRVHEKVQCLFDADAVVVCSSDCVPIFFHTFKYTLRIKKEMPLALSSLRKKKRVTHT